MTKTLLVIDQADQWICADWVDTIRDVGMTTPSAYLSDPEFAQRGRMRVCNLSRAYDYQSLGYYVSLLAEARGHRPFPDVMTMGDLAMPRSAGLVPQALEELIDKSLHSLTTDEFTLSVYFGENLARRYQRLARSLYAHFSAPLLRCRFRKKKRWRIQQVSAIALSAVPPAHHSFVADAARRYFNRPQLAKVKQKTWRYDLAILHDPREGELAPSCPTALKRFVKAAAAEGVSAELVTAAEAGRLLEFDALFIRETTAVNHHTYRLARRAAAAGMIVIDDPMSILRCTNKVYLAELLSRADLPMPATTVIHRGNQQAVREQLGFPCVLKRPDSAFSQGVAKAETPEEYDCLLRQFFEDSELLIAQEFMQTDFDWRIGLIDGEPLFACKYHMAKGHWQIAKHTAGASPKFGRFETMPVELAPRKCVQLARKASALVGNGFYGVDIKESQGHFYVIEINDNPNLDAGVEDKILRDELYRRIVRSFIQRIELKHGRP